MVDTKVQVPFDAMVRRHVVPVLKNAGFRRQGTRTWWEHREDGSWVLLQVQLAKWTTAADLDFAVNTVAWPPGTWDHAIVENPGWAARAVPFAAGNAPVYGRPQHIAPGLWPGSEFWPVDRHTDFYDLGVRLAAFMTAALAWGREAAGVEGALARGLRDDDAIVMLRAAAPDDPRLQELVDRYTRQWKSDPRPITRRHTVIRWRAEAGLEPLEDLPVYWHPAMMPRWLEVYGWPGAAHRVAPGGTFYYADGTETTDPPADWPRVSGRSRAQAPTARRSR